jgi:hypothetical protein
MNHRNVLIRIFFAWLIAMYPSINRAQQTQTNTIAVEFKELPNARVSKNDKQQLEFRGAQRACHETPVERNLIYGDVEK